MQFLLKPAPPHPPQTKPLSTIPDSIDDTPQLGVIPDNEPRIVLNNKPTVAPSKPTATPADGAVAAQADPPSATPT